MWRPGMAPALTGTIFGMGSLLSTMPPTCWPRLRGGVHQLGGQFRQLPPARGVHQVAEAGQRRHLLPQPGPVVGVKLLGKPLQVFFGQSQGLSQVLDDALDRVGADDPGQDGVLRPEAPVHPLDEFVAEGAGKIEVDVGQQAGVLGDEPLQGQAPVQGVHVADADEVAHQKGHRRTPAPARRPLFQGNLRLDQAFLQHDFLGQQDYLPVEQQETGQAVALDQPELLVQSLPHLEGWRAVAPLGGLVAQLPQVAGGSIALGNGGIGQGVPQVIGQVEITPIGDSDGVC